ncbi:MarR family transcriptional regulator [Ramlibacter sp. AN1015]|uniref:MarR family winged helix-turn-helix transcriptional regulator n=1 Tax=Ramlibacter sp. AN1015 TaxID=3133428 RepID=UPI0030BAA6FE
MAALRPDEWNVTHQLLYHLSFTSELIGIQEEVMLQRECALTLSEWRIMSVIASFTPIASKDITKVTTLNKVAVSRSLAKLVGEGLVERTVSDGDSRMQYLALSRAGKQRFRKAQGHFLRWSESLFGALSPAETKALKLSLTKVRRRLAEITDEERALSEEFIFGASP